MPSAKRHRRKVVPSRGAGLRRGLTGARGGNLTSQDDPPPAGSDKECGLPGNGLRNQAVTHMPALGDPVAGGRAANDGAKVREASLAQRICRVRVVVGERLRLDGVELTVSDSTSGEEGFLDAFEAFCGLLDPLSPSYIIVMREVLCRGSFIKVSPPQG